MAKPKNKYDLMHLRNMERYGRSILSIFQTAAEEAARIGASIDRYDPERPFRFSEYPRTMTRIERLIEELRSAIVVCVVDGVRSEWALANDKNDELSRRVFGDNIQNLTEDQLRRFFSTNEDAREAFLKRRDNGLGLSDRVWRYTDAYRSEIELAIDIGLRRGQSAQEMARDLKQYLRYPDKLFRRVRDEHGILNLSRNARLFHPGQGVYRSSYMNARRLAVTETNASYRSADHARWKQLDFVVGIEIHLSGNHTCLGRDGKPHAFHDICDELAGKYPKDFLFTGWHPNCRCYATSILKTAEEMAEDNRRIMRGEPVTNESANSVKDVPQAFKDWVVKNSARISKARSLPYFLLENEKYMNNALNGGSY